MTRLMYDSIDPGAIPSNAPLVAGYIDGVNPWPAYAWDRFTGVKVRIARNSLTDDGHVLDVEQGDAIPAWAPGWTRLRRRAGIEPAIYVNRANWQQVIDAFRAVGEPQPLYWVATLDGTQLPLVGGVVACQYAGADRSGGHYDLSIVTDSWPGPSPQPAGGFEVIHPSNFWAHVRAWYALYEQRTVEDGSLTNGEIGSWVNQVHPDGSNLDAVEQAFIDASKKDGGYALGRGQLKGARFTAQIQ